MVEDLTFRSRRSKPTPRKEEKEVKEGVVDLTYSKNQHKQPLKEIILPDGSIQEVPFARWKRTIITNPRGRTAVRATIRKDPDLDKIEIPIIEISSKDNRPTPDRPERELPKPTPVKDLTHSVISEEKRNKFLSAEFGRVGHWHKIEPLEKPEEEQEEE